MPKLLALLSNPDGKVKLRMDIEMKSINARISPQVNHDFYCRQVANITIDELPGLLIAEKPEMLHFSGHGNQQQLCFENRQGQPHNISHEALTEIFAETGRFLNCLLINACNSLKLASMIKKYVPYVIGFPDFIEDELATAFSQTFYETLSQGLTVPSCFRLAKAVIMTEITEDRLPELLIHETITMHSPIFSRPSIKAQFEVNDKSEPKKDKRAYKFRLWVENIPRSTTYLILETPDESIEIEDRFETMTDFTAGSFTQWPLEGNIIIRAWFWMDERKYGIGIETTLKECLHNHYGKEIPKNCQQAYQYIISN